MEEHKESSAHEKTKKQASIKKAKKVMGGGFSSFSLKAAAAGALRKPTENDQSNNTTSSTESSTLNEVVDQNSLQQAWLKYSKLYEEDRVLLAQTMTQHLPVLEADGKTYTITLFNAFQEEKIQEFQFDISEYLKREVKNSQIKMKVVIDETKEEKVYFTSTDKLKLMVETNPDLNLLRKTFDLDLE